MVQAAGKQGQARVVDRASPGVMKATLWLGLIFLPDMASMPTLEIAPLREGELEDRALNR